MVGLNSDRVELLLPNSNDNENDDANSSREFRFSGENHRDSSFALGSHHQFRGACVIAHLIQLAKACFFFFHGIAILIVAFQVLEYLPHSAHFIDDANGDVSWDDNTGKRRHSSSNHSSISGDIPPSGDDSDNVSPFIPPSWGACFIPLWIYYGLGFSMLALSLFSSITYVKICFRNSMPQIADGFPSLLTDVFPEIIRAVFGILFLLMCLGLEISLYEWASSGYEGIDVEYSPDSKMDADAFSNLSLTSPNTLSEGWKVGSTNGEGSNGDPIGFADPLDSSNGLNLIAVKKDSADSESYSDIADDSTDASSAESSLTLSDSIPSSISDSDSLLSPSKRFAWRGTNAVTEFTHNPKGDRNLNLGAQVEAAAEMVGAVGAAAEEFIENNIDGLKRSVEEIVESVKESAAENLGSGSVVSERSLTSNLESLKEGISDVLARKESKNSGKHKEKPESDGARMTLLEETQGMVHLVAKDSSKRNGDAKGDKIPKDNAGDDTPALPDDSDDPAAVPDSVLLPASVLVWLSLTFLASFIYGLLFRNALLISAVSLTCVTSGYLHRFVTPFWFLPPVDGDDHLPPIPIDIDPDDKGPHPPGPLVDQKSVCLSSNVCASQRLLITIAPFGVLALVILFNQILVLRKYHKVLRFEEKLWRGAEILFCLVGVGFVVAVSCIQDLDAWIAVLWLGCGCCLVAVSRLRLYMLEVWDPLLMRQLRESVAEVIARDASSGSASSGSGVGSGGNRSAGGARTISVNRNSVGNVGNPNNTSERSVRERSIRV